ncbi:hypothetical protein [Mesorhizobium sp. KR2-14]|uniref:hypothetical protein n=1 Tax=Mesorhizobium sp. KR2-14 TaxID=3156610 RepID=UPI0032B57962
MASRTLFHIAAAAILAGAAAAIVPTSAISGPNAADRRTSLTDPAVVAPLFSDDAMTILRPLQEMKNAWAKMPEENRMRVREDCKRPQDTREQDLCAAVESMERQQAY